MTIRVFTIEGMQRDDLHCVTCAILGCRTVDAQLAHAMQTLRQQIVAR